MFGKTLSLMLVSFLILTICITTSASAVARVDKEAQRIVKTKERVGAIHREKKRVVVTRRDGTKLKGYISEVSESSFFVKDEQTGSTGEIKYDDAAQVKTRGKGLSTGSKFLIGAGIVAAIVVVVLIVKPLGKSPFPKCNADRSNTPCDNN